MELRNESIFIDNLTKKENTDNIVAFIEEKLEEFDNM